MEYDLNQRPKDTFGRDELNVEMYSAEELRAFIEMLPDGPCNVTITVHMEGEGNGEQY